MEVTDVNDPVTLIQNFPDIFGTEDDTNGDTDQFLLIGNNPFVGSDYFADPDASNPVPQSIGLTVTSSVPSLVTAAVDPSGALLFDFKAFQSGTATMTITATDSDGSSASDTFQVTVAGVNQPVVNGTGTPWRKPSETTQEVIENEDFRPLKYNADYPQRRRRDFRRSGPAE